MSRLLAPSQLAVAHLVLSAAVLLWNIALAGQIARMRNVPRVMGALSAVAGLLIAPALFIQIASADLLAGRAMHTIAWAWPLTAAVFALQSLYAVMRGLSAPGIGLPIAIYDIALAIIYGFRYAVFVGDPVGVVPQSLVATEAAALALGAHPAAILAPYYLHLPLLTPASPGRRGLGTLLRSAAAALAVAWTTLMVISLPRATRAVRSYEEYRDDRLQERPEQDFAVGVKLLPKLGGALPELAVTSDLALADSVGAGALAVYVTPEGAGATALEALARILDQKRSGKQLIVALDFGSGPTLRTAAERGAYLGRRTADVERIARRVRPDFLVPALDPYGAAARRVGALPVETWTGYLASAAAAARRASAGTRVMAHVGGYTPRDSALYAWAAGPVSAVDVVGITLAPGYDGAAEMNARMRAMDERLTPVRAQKDHWVLEAYAFPIVYGEQAQEHALWGALAWATSEPAIKGLIVFQASDYGTATGLRASSGRLRPAARGVRRAIEALGEGG
ncbi:MAG: hypothetical protein ACREON_10025 [Gemmatimonadaceae bacterium]